MPISIDSLAGGGASERIEREMKKIAENVLDPNTNATATRKLVIEITIKPNEGRQMGNADISVKSSLAPAKGLPSAFVFDYDREGKAVVKEFAPAGADPNQLQHNSDGDVTDGVGTPVNKKVVNGVFR
ncbi:hypothetical protein EBB07_00945 [Paenibacillaceae bacterium]|nr:hypothetical protein EBB07_00945 [Paenibacillaceae bacterium]